MAVGEPIQLRLESGAKRAEIDAAGRLVQHAEHRLAWCRERHEGGSDAVQHDHVGPDLIDFGEHPRCVSDSPRKWALRERDETQLSGIRRRQLRQSTVKQVPASQLTRIAQRDQGGA